MLINGGGRGFRRDGEGVLRYYKVDGTSSSFQSFVLITALVLLGTAIYGFFALIITTWLGEKSFPSEQA